MRLPVDPDQDLLDQLYRREAGGPYFVAAVATGLAAMAGTVAYLTLILELGSDPWNRERFCNSGHYRFGRFIGCELLPL